MYLLDTDYNNQCFNIRVGQIEMGLGKHCPNLVKITGRPNVSFSAINGDRFKKPTLEVKYSAMRFSPTHWTFIR